MTDETILTMLKANLQIMPENTLQDEYLNSLITMLFCNIKCRNESDHIWLNNCKQKFLFSCHMFNVKCNILIKLNTNQKSLTSNFFNQW